MAALEAGHRDEVRQAHESTAVCCPASAALRLPRPPLSSPAHTHAHTYTHTHTSVGFPWSCSVLWRCNRNSPRRSLPFGLQTELGSLRQRLEDMENKTPSHRQLMNKMRSSIIAVQVRRACCQPSRSRSTNVPRWSKIRIVMSLPLSHEDDSSTVPSKGKRVTTAWAGVLHQRGVPASSIVRTQAWLCVLPSSPGYRE